MSLTKLGDVSLIATHVQNCLEGFHCVCNEFIKADRAIRNKVPPGAIHDALGRFRLWVGNIGAHRTGRASLDYKLREASHIRDRVIELLQNLESVLREALEIVTGERVPWEDLSDSESDVSETDLATPDDEASTELAQLASNMTEINSCLMRLSLAIRNPAPHDQFKESRQIDVTHFEAFDIEHVRGKFPSASEYLVLRLGKAISRRRQYLRYREEHRKKLEQGLPVQPLPQEIESTQDAVRTPTAPSEKIESTVASSIPLAVKASISSSNLDEIDYYEDTLSQTSYASSNNDSSKLRPPPLPEAGQDGDPFECPLCFRFTSVRQTPAWHKHVYRDLQPYVCTFDQCEIADRTYESRHEWFQHEIHAHRKWWECIEGCNATFRTLDAFHEHLATEHPDLASTSRTSDLVRNCERQDTMDLAAGCPLCHIQLPSLTQLRRHLGKHHDELSLFALPSYLKEDDNEVDDDDIDDGSRSSIAGSNNAQPMSIIRCGQCDLRFEGPAPAEDLSRHEIEIHGIPINEPSMSANPLFEKAKKLLEERPSIVQAMDDHVIDSTLIEPAARIQKPDEVTTWAQYKQWLTGPEKPDAPPVPANIEHIHLLQAIMFHIMLVTQEADEYFERLLDFHKDRVSEGLEIVYFKVDGISLSFYQIVKAMISQGGMSVLEKPQDWANLGYHLGWSKGLTLDGARLVKDLYSRYVSPFEAHIRLFEGGIAKDQSLIDLSVRFKSTQKLFDLELKDIPSTTTIWSLRGLILNARPQMEAPERMSLLFEGRPLWHSDTLDTILTPGAADTSIDVDFSQRTPVEIPLPNLMGLATEMPETVLPAPGRLVIAHDRWLYLPQANNQCFQIHLNSIRDFAILIPNRIMIKSPLTELASGSWSLLQNEKVFLDFHDEGDFSAACEHIKHRMPKMLGYVQDIADEPITKSSTLSSSAVVESYNIRVITGTLVTKKVPATIQVVDGMLTIEVTPELKWKLGDIGPGNESLRPNKAQLFAHNHQFEVRGLKNEDSGEQEDVLFKAQVPGETTQIWAMIQNFLREQVEEAAPTSEELTMSERSRNIEDDVEVNDQPTTSLTTRLDDDSSEPRRYAQDDDEGANRPDNKQKVPSESNDTISDGENQSNPQGGTASGHIDTSTSIPGISIREITECLGLDLSASSSTVNRGVPKFDNADYRKLASGVTKLSKELPRDDDALLHFTADPQSLDNELEELLETYGPCIWGKDADRSCLRIPDLTKRKYGTKDLYFEDVKHKHIIKIHLRAWIIIKASLPMRSLENWGRSGAGDRERDTIADIDAMLFNGLRACWNQLAAERGEHHLDSMNVLDRADPSEASENTSDSDSEDLPEPLLPPNDKSSITHFHNVKVTGLHKGQYTKTEFEIAAVQLAEKRMYLKSFARGPYNTFMRYRRMKLVKIEGQVINILGQVEMRRRGSRYEENLATIGNHEISLQSQEEGAAVALYQQICDRRSFYGIAARHDDVGDFAHDSLGQEITTGDSNIASPTNARQGSEKDDNVSKEQDLPVEDLQDTIQAHGAQDMDVATKTDAVNEIDESGNDSEESHSELLAKHQAFYDDPPLSDPSDTAGDPTLPGGYFDKLYHDLTEIPFKPQYSSEKFVEREFAAFMEKEYSWLTPASRQTAQGYSIHRKWQMLCRLRAEKNHQGLRQPSTAAGPASPRTPGLLDEKDFPVRHQRNSKSLSLEDVSRESPDEPLFVDVAQEQHAFLTKMFQDMRRDEPTSSPGSVATKSLLDVEGTLNADEQTLDFPGPSSKPEEFIKEKHDGDGTGPSLPIISEATLADQAAIHDHVRPYSFENAESDRSDARLDESVLERMKELHVESESESESESSDNEEQMIRRYRAKKKRWRAGMIKRSHSQGVEGDSSYSDDDSLDLINPKARRLRRRVRGPQDRRVSLILQDPESQGQLNVESSKIYPGSTATDVNDHPNDARNIIKIGCSWQKSEIDVWLDLEKNYQAFLEDLSTALDVDLGTASIEFRTLVRTTRASMFLPPTPVVSQEDWADAVSWLKYHSSSKGPQIQAIIKDRPELDPSNSTQAGTHVKAAADVEGQDIIQPPFERSINATPAVVQEQKHGNHSDNDETAAHTDSSERILIRCAWAQLVFDIWLEMDISCQEFLSALKSMLDSRNAKLDLSIALFEFRSLEKRTGYQTPFGSYILPLAQGRLEAEWDACVEWLRRNRGAEAPHMSADIREAPPQAPGGVVRNAAGAEKRKKAEVESLLDQRDISSVPTTKSQSGILGDHEIKLVLAENNAPAQFSMQFTWQRRILSISFDPSIGWQDFLNRLEIMLLSRDDSIDLSTASLLCRSHYEGPCGTYPVSLAREHLEIDWEHFAQWLRENKRPYPPHIYANLDGARVLPSKSAGDENSPKNEDTNATSVESLSQRDNEHNIERGNSSRAVLQSERIRMRCIWDDRQFHVWLDLNESCEAAYAAIENELARRNIPIDRNVTSIWLKPGPEVPDYEAYELLLQTDDLEADWELTLQWLHENKRKHAPHIYGSVEVDGDFAGTKTSLAPTQDTSPPTRDVAHTKMAIAECLVCMNDELPVHETVKLTCGHRICHSCLKRKFILSVQDARHMPPQCCTSATIPLSQADRLFDDEFKILWNKKYQEYTGAIVVGAETQRRSNLRPAAVPLQESGKRGDDNSDEFVRTTDLGQVRVQCMWKSSSFAFLFHLRASPEAFIAAFSDQFWKLTVPFDLTYTSLNITSEKGNRDTVLSLPLSVSKLQPVWDEVVSWLRDNLTAENPDISAERAHISAVIRIHARPVVGKRQQPIIPFRSYWSMSTSGKMKLVTVTLRTRDTPSRILLDGETQGDDESEAEDNTGTTNHKTGESTTDSKKTPPIAAEAIMDSAIDEILEQNDSRTYPVRIYREDSTFTTVSATLNTTVGEIIRTLRKKTVPLDELENCCIEMRSQNDSRRLESQEQPILIQKRILEQAGYTSYDEIWALGCKDTSPLCRFTFLTTSSLEPLNRQSKGKEKAPTPPTTPHTYRPSKANNYWGFCKGAWKVREDAKMGLALRIRPRSMYNTKDVWECTHCDFYGNAFSAPHPTKKAIMVNVVDPRVITSRSQIRYKWIFLAKSHVKKKRSISEDNNYCCLFCSLEDRVSSVYGGAEALMNHIAQRHSADMSEDTRREARCILGRQAGDSETEWDIHIPGKLETE